MDAGESKKKWFLIFEPLRSTTDLILLSQNTYPIRRQMRASNAGSGMTETAIFF